MRVVFYTRPSLLDAALGLVQVLSREVELHVLLELAPESWRTGVFDIEARNLPAGVVSGDVLGQELPRAVAAHLERVADFKLVVHTSRGSVRPGTWRTSHRAMQYIRSLHPDIVHFDDVSLRLGWSVRELRGVPVVFSVHDPEAHTGENEWRTNVAYWLSHRHAARFILHSRALKAAFCSRFGLSEDRVDVVRLGTYEVFRALAPGLGTSTLPTVLFFGRVSPYKGLDLLYRAAPLVAQAVPGVRFVVAGRPIRGYDPPPPPHLPNGARVEVIDRYIPNAQLGELFLQASLVVCPYLDATQSGVVMTAYAFDRPVIATEVGGLPEYVWSGQTGLVVPPLDHRALASALVSVLGDRGLREHLAHGIQAARADELSWVRAGRETLEVYARASARQSAA